jgi:hypothetical protein
VIKTNDTEKAAANLKFARPRCRPHLRR